MSKVRLLLRPTTLETLQETLIKKRTKHGLIPCAVYLTPNPDTTTVIKFFAQSLSIVHKSWWMFWRKPSLTIYGFVIKNLHKKNGNIDKENIKVVVKPLAYFIDEPGVTVDLGVVYFGGDNIEVLRQTLA